MPDSADRCDQDISIIVINTYAHMHCTADVHVVPRQGLNAAELRYAAWTLWHDRRGLVTICIFWRMLLHKDCSPAFY